MENNDKKKRKQESIVLITVKNINTPGIIMNWRDFLQTFSNSFSCKGIVFWSNFHQSLWPWVFDTKPAQGLDNGKAPNRPQFIIQIYGGQFNAAYMRHTNELFTSHATYLSLAWLLVIHWGIWKKKT